MCLEELAQGRGLRRRCMALGYQGGAGAASRGRSGRKGFDLTCAARPESWWFRPGQRAQVSAGAEIGWGSTRCFLSGEGRAGSEAVSRGVHAVDAGLSCWGLG